MRVSATPIPRFASGVPSTDIGFPVFVGRFMGTGTRVGTRIHPKYAPMFSTCSKITRAYKDDPNNLDTNELERIEKVMVEATLPSAFTTREDFIHALFKLKFPGYGLGGIGSQPQTDDGSALI